MYYLDSIILSHRRSFDHRGVWRLTKPHVSSTRSSGRGKIGENRIFSFEDLLISQVVQEEALPRLLMEKGIFSKEELFEMVKVVDREMKGKKKVAA